MSDPVPSSCIKPVRPGGQPCARILSVVDRRWARPWLEPDYCGFCEMPLTERAKNQRRPPGIATREAVME